MFDSSTRPVIRFLKIHPDARVPEYKTKLSAACDIYTVEDAVIPPGEKAILPTGLKVAMPEWLQMNVIPRSGIAAKAEYSVIISNSPGLIDPDYPEECKIILWNIGDKPQKIEKGERICQVTFSPRLQVLWQEVPTENEYLMARRLMGISTDRVGGLGSTGNK